MNSEVFFQSVSSSYASRQVCALPSVQQTKYDVLHVVAEKSELGLHGSPDVDGVSSRDLNHTLVADIV